LLPRGGHHSVFEALDGEVQRLGLGLLRGQPRLVQSGERVDDALQPIRIDRVFE
jgi:hypothetical protein